MENSTAVDSLVTTDVVADEPLFPDVEFSASGNVAIGVAYTFLCVLVGVSNVFNVVVILKTRQLQNLNGYMMICLAVVDFLVGVTMPFPFLMGISLGFVPETVCGIVGTLSAAPAHISIGLLALMSVDRFVAIAHPLHYNHIMTFPRCMVAIVLIIIITPVVYFLPFFGVGFYVVDRTLLCMPAFDTVVIWLTNVFLVYGIASVIIAACYIRIWRIIKHQKKQIQAQIDAVGAQPGNASVKNRKTVRTLLIIVLGFYLAWTPLCMYYIILSLSSYTLVIPLWTEVIFLCLSILNSFWNVIIYLATNRAFRMTAQRILKIGLNRTMPMSNGTDLSISQSIT